MAFQTFICAGNLTREPEMRTTPAGKDVCQFGVAWNKDAKKDSPKIFLNCSAFGPTGKFVNDFFHKGDAIILEGELTVREYENRNKEKAVSVDLFVRNASFGGGKRESSPTPLPDAQVTEEIPF